MSTSAALLAGAVKVLDQQGWIQGHRRSTDGYCALAAMEQAASDMGLHHSVAEQIMDAACALLVREMPEDAQRLQRSRSLPYHRFSVSIWNDTPGRTHSEVRQLMRSTALTEAMNSDTSHIDT